MYKFKIALKIDKIDTHLNVEPNPDVDQFGVYEFDPTDYRKSFIPECAQGMPQENLKELEETGKTIYTVTETTTISVEKQLVNN